MFSSGPAVELVDPDLLSAQVVRVSRVVFDVKPEISRALLRFLHKGRDRQNVKKKVETDCTGVDSNLCCWFYGTGVKKILLQGLKTEITSWKLWLWHFRVCLLSFNWHIFMQCIYKLLTVLQDMLMKSEFE